MGRLLRFWSLPRREKERFCEASILLLLSSVCVKTIPFKYIDSFLREHWRDGAPDSLDHTDDIKLVILSLSRAASLLPLSSLCLVRSIAAFIMLRRRGIPAVIVVGVKFSEDSSLVAHAWVQTGHDVADPNTENFGFTALLTIRPDPVIV
jgi:hypothetical protein